MNGRIAYKRKLLLEALGSKEMDSKQLSEEVSKKGLDATPRQVTAFIKGYLNNIVNVRKNYVRIGGSYHNVYRVVPGTVNVS